MVYGVFSGCYSDWQVYGYFEDEEKAKAFCERVNKNAKNEWDELYIKELPNLENGTADNAKICLDVYTEDWSVGYSYEDEDEIIDYGDGTATIRMMLHPSQYDKAVKIAQDRWAQYRAEKEGLT